MQELPKGGMLSSCHDGRIPPSLRGICPLSQLPCQNIYCRLLRTPFMSMPHRYQFLCLLALSFLFILPAAPTATAQGTGDLTSIADARAEGEGATVLIEGVVSRAFGAYARIQDTSGPLGASGIVIRQVDGPDADAFQDAIEDGTIQPGTVLRVEGTLSAFNDLLQINGDDLESFTVIDQGDAPEPVVATAAEIAGSGAEATFESILVRVEGLQLSGVEAGEDFDTNTSYTAQDAAGTTVAFRVQQSDETAIGGTPVPTGSFIYEGVVGVFNTEAQLIPVRTTDWTTVPSVRFDRAFALSLEGDTGVTVSIRSENLSSDDIVDVTASVTGGDATVGGDVTGFSDPTTFTFSGSDPAPELLSFNITDDGEEEGIERVEITLETESAVASTAFPQTLTLWIKDDATAQTTLYPGLEGTDLAEQLRQDFGDPPTFMYDVARDTLYGQVYNTGGEVEAFYTGFTAPLLDGESPRESMAMGGINTEHLWPQSLGAGELPARSNMHILVPAREDVNSARSNYAFGTIPPGDVDVWYRDDTNQNFAPPPAQQPEWSRVLSAPSDRNDRRFEPRDVAKGEVARSMFYFQLVYPQRAAPGFLSVQEADLRAWHADHPVSADEQRRNVLIASYQGNKLNPFALDPTLVDRVDLTPTAEALTIAEARETRETLVTVEGTVSRAFGSYVRLQDASGALGASGITIRQTTGALSSDFRDDITNGTIQPGTVLRISGLVSDFRNLVQVNGGDLSSYEVVAQETPPAPQEVTLREIAESEGAYESVLVRVPGLFFPEASAATFSNGQSYTARDLNGGTLTFRVQGDNETEVGGEAIPEAPITYAGVVGVFEDDIQLLPMRPADLARDVDFPVVSLTIDEAFPDFTDPSSYRLVGVPGIADLTFENTFSGTAGTSYRIFADNGADGAPSDYLEEQEGNDTYALGQGYWALARESWTVEADVFAPQLTTDGTFDLPLQAGWNIVVNPFDSALDWDQVQADNGIDNPQPLWAFTGAFEQTSTFAPGTTGEAFYFLNATDEPSLTLTPSAQQASQTATTQRAEAHMLTLEAYVAGERRGRVRLGTAAQARAFVAPRAPFGGAMLHAVGEDDRRLATQVQAAGGSGRYSFTLALEGAAGDRVTLRPTSRPGLDDYALMLRLPDGEAVDLRTHDDLTLTLQQNRVALQVVLAATDGLHEADRPEAVELRGNYPNPFSTETTLEYALPERSAVQLEVFNVLGQRVAMLVEEVQPPGRYDVQWDGRSDAGHALASGVYIARLTANGETRSDRITYVP